MESAGIAGRGSAALARLVRRGVGRCRTRGIVYGLINSANRGLTDPVVLGCVALGTGLLLEFILVEGRSEAPMLPLDLSRSRTLSRAAGAVAAEIMGVFMRGTFEACLDDRLESVPLPADAAEALDEETVKLAAANIPTEFDAETTAQVQAAIDVSRLGVSDRLRHVQYRGAGERSHRGGDDRGHASACIRPERSERNCPTGNHAGSDLTDREDRHARHSGMPRGNPRTCSRR